MSGSNQCLPLNLGPYGILTETVLVLLLVLGDLDPEDILSSACWTSSSALALDLRILLMILEDELLDERDNLLHRHLLAVVHADGILEESGADD